MHLAIAIKPPTFSEDDSAPPSIELGLLISESGLSFMLWKWIVWPLLRDDSKCELLNNIASAIQPIVDRRFGKELFLSRGYSIELGSLAITVALIGMGAGAYAFLKDYKV